MVATSRTSLLAAAGALVGAAAVAYGLLIRGWLRVDLGVGRSLRPLGPLTLRIDAPREVVFEVISAPYLGRTPRALERGVGVVLAEHFTHHRRFVTTTLETVRFERPSRVHFRLVRGPVPHVVERFELGESALGTELRYSGELGTDLWAWLPLVAPAGLHEGFHPRHPGRSGLTPDGSDSWHRPRAWDAASGTARNDLPDLPCSRWTTSACPPEIYSSPSSSLRPAVATTGFMRAHLRVVRALTPSYSKGSWYGRTPTPERRASRFFGR